MDEKEVLNQLIYAHLSFAPGNVYWAKTNKYTSGEPASKDKTVSKGRRERTSAHPIEAIGQTSKGRSFQLASCRPPLSAQRTHEGGPRLPMFFGFNTARGNVKAFCIGGVL